MHAELINQTGGSDGIRDNSLLEATIIAPFQEFGGQELFPTIQSKAARLGYGLIKNHAMIDGKKRIGTHAMLIFLSLNRIELAYTQKELYTVILDVALYETTIHAYLACDNTARRADNKKRRYVSR